MNNDEALLASGAAPPAPPPRPFADSGNPYAPPADLAEVAAALPSVVVPTRPRVWTVFVALGALVAALLASQIVAGIGLVIWYFSQGGAPDRIGTELLDFAVQPPAFILLGLAGQLAIGGVALIAAWLSPVPFAQRLGLVRPKWTAAQCAIGIVGSIVPFAIGMAGAYALAAFIEPDASVEKMYEAMTPAWAVPFLLFIALVPGVFEEVMFRGYLQQRLLERWPAAAAILFSSLVFGLMHFTPHAITFAFVLGIWLGMLAWHSGSTWPGIVCHAAINGLWNVWQLGVRFELFPENPPLVLLVLLSVVGVGAFAASLWLMFGGGQANISTRAE